MNKLPNEPIGIQQENLFGFMPERADDDVDFNELLFSLLRRKWLIVGCTLLSAVLFWLLSAQMLTYFTARATLMLDPRETQISTSQELVADLQLSNPIVESEVAVIQSNDLLEQVIGRIGVDRIDRLYTEAYLAKSPFVWLRKSGAGDVSGGRADGAQVGSDLIPPEQVRMNRVSSYIREGLTVRRVGQSYVIEVLARTVDPQLSSLVANHLAEAYIERQTSLRREAAVRATAWLSDQADAQRAQVEAAEAAVEDFKSAQLVSEGASAEIVSQQMIAQNDQLARVRAEIAAAKAQVRQLEAVLRSGGAPAVGELLSSPLFETLREKRLALLQEEATLATKFGPEHPDRRQITSMIKQLDEEMAQEVRKLVAGFRNDVRILEFHEQTLLQNVSALEAKLAAISRASLELRQLEREADALRGTYEDWLARLSEARSQVELQRAEAVLVNAAKIPAGPSAPRPKLLTAFGAVVGLAIGLVVTVVFETSSRGYARVIQLEQAVRVPVVGCLPKRKMSGSDGISSFLSSGPYSLFGERVRQLRETLLNRIDAEAAQCVVVLSSLPNEGKSTTALALARVFALSNRKTVLLDLDLRHSSAYRLFKSDKPHDLADVISGRTTLGEAIAQGGDFGFDVLGGSCGKLALSDALHQSELVALIDELKQHYEVVIVDAPPVLAVSDALMAASAADFLLYLVRWRKTPKRAVKNGLSQLASMGVRADGMVLTMVSAKQDPDNYLRRYGYG